MSLNDDFEKLADKLPYMTKRNKREKSWEVGRKPWDFRWSSSCIPNDWWEVGYMRNTKLNDAVIIHYRWMEVILWKPIARKHGIHQNNKKIHRQRCYIYIYIYVMYRVTKEKTSENSLVPTSSWKICNKSKIVYLLLNSLAFVDSGVMLYGSSWIIEQHKMHFWHNDRVL